MSTFVLSSYEREQIKNIKAASSQRDNLYSSLSEGRIQQDNPAYSYITSSTKQHVNAISNIDSQLNDLSKQALSFKTYINQIDMAETFTQKAKDFALLAQSSTDASERSYYAQEANKFWQHSVDALTTAPNGMTPYFQKTSIAQTGTNGAETIVGTNDVDILYGRNGNDLIIGGEANDVIYGENGADQVRGQNGDDILIGGAGNDVFQGGNDDDVLIGGLGNDNMQGQNGNDLIFGVTGANTLNGGDGDDIIVGGDGADNIIGGNGNDIIYVGDSTNLTRAGNGDDIIILGSDNGYDARGQNGNDIIIDNINSSSTVRGNGGTDAYVFTGSFSDYTLSTTGTWRTVTHNESGVVDTFNHNNTEYLVFDDGYYHRATASFTAGESPITIPEIAAAPDVENYTPIGHNGSSATISPNPDAGASGESFGWAGPSFNWQYDASLSLDIQNLDSVLTSLKNYSGQVQNELDLTLATSDFFEKKTALHQDNVDSLNDIDLNELASKAKASDVQAQLSLNASGILSNSKQQGLLTLFNF